MIPDSIINEVRERVDMVALVGEHVRLQKRGNSHVGLCPFHAEKTPSFHVSAGNKFFHCFGCKESGDPFRFLMLIDGVAFPQAARALAERVGVEVPVTEHASDAAERKQRQRMERLAAITEEATAFYEQALRDAPGSEGARAEIERRGVAPAIAAQFRLGYAPHAWDALVSRLREKTCSLTEAEEVGVISRRRDSSGYYDRFRGRLMFPVRELGGHVVAFSGRALPGPNGVIAEGEPKYMNSPEGPLYHKGSVLYGLHEARVSVRRHGWAVLCEGNFDLLSLHQAGVDNAVAPMGTAFTAAQAKLLRRFAERIVLLFDGDAAGQKAVRAAFPVLQEQGLRASVATLPTGEDPDSYLRARGAEALERLVKQAQGIVEHLIDSAALTASSAAERAGAIESLAPVLGQVENPVELELYVERVAQRFGLPDGSAVRRQLRARRSGQQAQPPENRSGPPRGTPPGAGGPGGAPKSPLAEPKERVKLPQLQTELLGALLDQPTLLASAEAARLRGLLTSPALALVLSAAETAIQENGALDLSALLSALEGNPAQQWVTERLSLSPQRDVHDAHEVLKNGIPLLEKHNLELELPRLSRQISEARHAGDEDRALELTRQRDELRRSAQTRERRER